MVRVSLRKIAGYRDFSIALIFNWIAPELGLSERFAENKDVIEAPYIFMKKSKIGANRRPILYQNRKMSITRVSCRKYSHLIKFHPCSP